MVAVYGYDGKTIVCREPPYTEEEALEIYRGTTGPLTILHGPPVQAHAPKPQPPTAAPLPPEEKPT